jgi:hypothetical protein
MKTSSIWKTLSRDQRRAWNAWAKSNPMLLDDGSMRRVSGRTAMIGVVRNRERAGEALNPVTVPAAVTWMTGQVFSLRDAGPFTLNSGYIGFRAEQPVAAGLKFFVWATPPLPTVQTDPDRLQFICCLTTGAMAFDDVVATIGPSYAAVIGSWDGPGQDGEWPEPHNILFRVHQYANGQLGPAMVMMDGRIQVQL